MSRFAGALYLNPDFEIGTRFFCHRPTGLRDHAKNMHGAAAHAPRPVGAVALALPA